MKKNIYKAKRVDNGEWVYGPHMRTENGLKSQILFIKEAGETFIEFGWYDVIPETVCKVQTNDLKKWRGRR